MADVLFVQMARQPVPGKVKTRLQPALGEQGAAELHRQMMLHTWKTLGCLGQTRALWVEGDPADKTFDECRAAEAEIRVQQGEDLGQRMELAFTESLRSHARVVMVGSDCPSLDADYLSQASSALRDHDAVLGPAMDGGYVLIGLRRHAPALFRGMAWGESTVYAATVAVLEQLGWKWCALRSLPDIDRPEDLRYLPDGFELRRG